MDYYKISPHALKIAAGSLYGKPEEFWQRKLGSLSSRLSSESELLACLQSSLDDSNVNLKECFMDLGSFPKDQRIPAATLIDMWMELYELNEETDGIVKLLNLTTWNLANLVNKRCVVYFTFIGMVFLRLTANFFVYVLQVKIL